MFVMMYSIILIPSIIYCKIVGWAIKGIGQYIEQRFSRSYAKIDIDVRK